MILKGKAHKFEQDDINTDYIISGKYKFKSLDLKEMATHVMEDLDPDFYTRVKPGDFIIAGKNFGCGSSREQAPLAIIHAGIAAVIADSFARIFYRNAVNTGLPVLVCDTKGIGPEDELEIDLDRGTIKNLTRGTELETSPLPSVMIKILSDGGLVEHFKKHGTYNFD